MGWLEKLFGRNTGGEEESPGTPESAPVPAAPATNPFAGLEGIPFGRYVDNNKSYARLQQFNRAEELFRQKDYAGAFAAFFDHIRDPEADNVTFHQEGTTFTFRLVQGSCVINGHCDGECIIARTCLATMEQPSRAVMRRLLDLNFTLYYSRCALNEHNTLCMLFDSYVSVAAPVKLLNGLRELATRADGQDDLLLADFPVLKPADVGHIEPLPPAELDVKYDFFRKWISEGLDRVAQLNQDSFSGAIAYYLLTIIYRIDFLIMPEARLRADLEEIHSTYWDKKDELTLVERNQIMKDSLRKLLELPKEAFAASVYRSKNTFSPLPVPKMDKVRENINGANRDAATNMDKKYPDLALVLNEYGVMYNPFLYNMPQVLKDLAVVYMATLHSAFFRSLGQQTAFYDNETKIFDKEAIKAAIDAAIAKYQDKYVSLKWDHDRIKWGGLYEFGRSFSEAMSRLDLEIKKVTE